MYIFTCAYKYTRVHTNIKFTQILQFQSTGIPSPILYLNFSFFTVRTLVPSKINTVTFVQSDIRCKIVQNCFTCTTAINKHATMNSGLLTSSSLCYIQPCPKLILVKYCVHKLLGFILFSIFLSSFSPPSVLPFLPLSPPCLSFSFLPSSLLPLMNSLSLQLGYSLHLQYKQD